mmetsp:Transcript_32889/g.47518  ORF Transcript_32889/g.47518 Transcript_32889/m.47518 type:complete len:856 (+) Transcript_32889:71-2638(+)|eukprot:CAMPEP_0170068640 /NCGR_PEP_ID=MMETSP0019_2-20121128/7552_1 /TAXON_ID=98059 /ORGANISM="Dinobryon sp., Strain UTEXLB2267" /LENGTH=855 /DNA_ID=CAMNT_0010276361 /DNA_START=70 /DNA_END=2637 /DNA_ORIENTATION=-
MDLATVLQNAQHPTQTIRAEAETFLNQAVEAQYGSFLLALCVELATEGKPESSRQLAGLYIKNMITAQDETILEAKINKWIQCDPTSKENIRAGFLAAIKSPVKIVSHTAAQILAAYGAVDLPRKEWPNLLSSLFHNISSPEMHVVCKVASLETLGYMCDTMDPGSIEQPMVNQILCSIIDGMRSDRVDDIRVAAVTALNNSLEFTKSNFDNKVESDAIMVAICEATQSTEIKIRERAFECFATVADLYYEKLQPYVETMFNLSTGAIQNDQQSVGIQAIEFWNTVCDREIEVLEELEQDPSATYLKLTAVAAPTLVPLLLQNMTKQVEDSDEDDAWNISMSAATCLESVSQVIQNTVVDMVIPFVTTNIISPDWRLKEASIMAFGMILAGPNPDKIAPYVAQAMPVLINCLKDANVLVRDTSAWTIGKICELHKNALSAEILPPMVSALAGALEDAAPKVVSQACFAVHNLAEACGDESEATSNVLSHFMPLMLQKLFVVASRSDSEVENIRSSAYEAMNRMVVNCAQDMQPIVLQLLTEVISRLEQSFAPQLTSSERTNLQSCLCSLTGEIVKKLELNDLSPTADRMMQVLFQVFNNKGATAHEDALIAIGYIAEKMEKTFMRYMPYLQGPLMAGLKTIEEYQLVTISVTVVGDLCRALGKDILPFCDDIMRLLLELLQSQTLNRSVKPHVISVFSDISLAIEGDFERYTNVILGILKQAGEVNLSPETDDEDLIDYINNLRNSILEAYTGILQGLGASKKQDSIAPAVDSIVEFLCRSTEDQHRSDEVLKSAIGLLGDMGQTFGLKMQALYQQRFVMELVRQGLSSDEKDIIEVATWAETLVTAISQGRIPK